MSEPSPRDAWSIAYRNASIWGYLRTQYHGQEVTAFHPRVRFGWADILGGLRFLVLRWSSRKIVVACLNRPDVLAFVRSMLAPGSYVLFLRSELAPGNSFFIEAVRVVFRLWARFFRRAELAAIMARLQQFDARYGWNPADVLAAMGDYHYNRWLRFFLKGKTVYYTNCIVPKIEKHMGEHLSVELQHGIIHRDHLDYAGMPAQVIKSRLVVWDAFWRDRLVAQFHYGGEVLCGSFSLAGGDADCTHEVIIYATVSDDMSRMIEAYRPVGDVALQLHPRDYFSYTDLASRYVLIHGTMPNRARHVLINDSTLILHCVANRQYFFYLRLPGEQEQNIQARLLDKYAAVHRAHYETVGTLEEAFDRMAERDKACLKPSKGVPA